VKRSLKNRGVNERSVNKDSLGFNRHDVMLLLWKNAEWLNEHIHKKQLKINSALRQRVYMIQVQSGVCKTLLYGLKDEELEQRVEKLEEQIKDAVVIPNEKH